LDCAGSLPRRSKEKAGAERRRRFRAGDEHSNFHPFRVDESGVALRFAAASLKARMSSCRFSVFTSLGSSPVISSPSTRHGCVLPAGRIQSAKLKSPNTKVEKFEDVVKSAQDAAVLVLVY
jgi:hypothetical protein